MSRERCLTGVVLALGLATLLPAQEAADTTGAPETPESLRLVAVADGIRVTLQPQTGDEIELRLLIENLGDREVEFVPVSIRGTAETRSDGHLRRVHLRTYEADQYRNILRRRYHTRGGVTAHGLSGEKRENPAPRFSAREAQRRREADRDARVRGRTPSVPVKTVETARRDPVSPVTRPDHDRPGIAVIPPLPGYLLERTTLAASDSIEGSVYLKHRRADEYHVVVPVGETEFEFTFALP